MTGPTLPAPPGRSKFWRLHRSTVTHLPPWASRTRSPEVRALPRHLHLWQRKPQRLLRSGLQSLTPGLDKDRHQDCAAWKARLMSWNHTFLRPSPSNTPGRTWDLERPKLPELSLFLLIKWKGNSYLSRVGQQLNEVTYRAWGLRVTAWSQML